MINKRILTMGMLGTMLVGCIAPTVSVYASESESHSSIQYKMYNYMLSASHQNEVTNEAINLHDGDVHNTCVYFMSTVLRKAGVNIPLSTGYTTTLKNQLEERGWVRDTNMDNLKPGDIVFCGTSHVYMFMGWADKGKKIANIVDNQRHIYGTVYRTRYVNGHIVPGDSIRSHDKSTEFYRFVDQKKNNQNTYPGKVVNINTYLNLRSGATTNSQIVGRLYKNNSVNIISKVGSWYKLLYNGRIAYAYGEYISPSSSSSSAKKVGKKMGQVQRVSSYLTIRNGNSTNCRAIGSLRPNQKVEVLSSSNGWYKINNNGKIGWVYGYYLRVL